MPLTIAGEVGSEDPFAIQPRAACKAREAHQGKLSEEAEGGKDAQHRLASQRDCRGLCLACIQGPCMSAGRNAECLWRVLKFMFASCTMPGMMQDTP